MYVNASCNNCRPKQHAGHAMQRIHSVTLSRNTDKYKAVKKCFYQAARQVFSGHATVQRAGSVSKGTGVQTLSDYDFYVRLTDGHPRVTHKERMEFLETAQQHLRQSGISYDCYARVNCLWFYNGSIIGQPLPDSDVCFQRFKGSTKSPPNNNAMASSPNGKEVVRYIKELPLKFTNVAKPKSMFLEDLVRRMEQERVPQAARRPGRQGFDTLLRYSLQAIADLQYKQTMALARLDNQEWQNVAQKVLNLQKANGSWP